MASKTREPFKYLDQEDLANFSAQDCTGKCALCKFWEAFENPVYPEVLTGIDVRDAIYGGLCKRYPPVSDNDDQDESNFPVTSWYEWCGEHVPARTKMPCCGPGESLDGK